MPPRSVVCLVALVATMLAGCGFLDEHAESTTTTTAPGPTTTTVPRGTPSSFDRLLPGQCFDKPPAEDQRAHGVLVIPCEEPHLYELYAQLTYTDPEGRKANLSVPYPGETAVRTRAEALCLEQFEPWIGTAWTQSDYDIETWWPSSDSWTRRDRTILCAAYRYDGERTEGSVRGSGE